MKSWQRVWREGAAPLLSTPSLKALAKALEEDNPKLIQGATTIPAPLQCVMGWPVEGACLLGFCGWTDLELEGWDEVTVGDVEHRFALLCMHIDERLGEPAAVRFLLNMFDDGNRAEVFSQLLEEVKRTLTERDNDGNSNG